MNARMTTMVDGKFESDKYFRLLCAGSAPADHRSGSGSSSTAASHDVAGADPAGGDSQESPVIYLDHVDEHPMQEADRRLDFSNNRLGGVPSTSIVDGLGRKHPFHVPRMGLGNVRNARTETRLVARTAHKQLWRALNALVPVEGESRLLLLHGSPGVGKTAMSLLLADHLRYRAIYPGGVFVVPIGDIQSDRPPVDGAASGYFAEQEARRKAPSLNLQPPRNEIEERQPRIYGQPVAGGGRGLRAAGMASGGPGLALPQMGVIEEGLGSSDQAPAAAAPAPSGSSTDGMRPLHARWRFALWRRVRDCVLAGVGHALADSRERARYLQTEVAAVRDKLGEIRAQQAAVGAGPGAATRPALPSEALLAQSAAVENRLNILEHELRV